MCQISSDKRQVCVTLTGTKNLTTATEIKTVAGDTNHAETETKFASYVERLLAQLENDGRRQSTVNNYRKALRHLVKHGANLLDPENTKEVLAKSLMKARTKKCNVVPILDYWFDFMGIQWKRPRYSGARAEIPYMPTEQEIDTLISGCGKKMATYLQLLKDTGARCGEISRLNWASIDFQRKVVRINARAEKGSNSRIVPISAKAAEMLNNLPRNGERIFVNAENIRSSFFIQRRGLARKLANLRLLQIHFHTLRHWKGTEEQHRTKDPWHVKELLGHKSITSTETYIHIEQQLYQNNTNDEFTGKVATTKEEKLALIDAGFEFVSVDPDGTQYFRKRK